jgi:hypothetical protein
MKYVFFLLSLFALSCGSNPNKQEKTSISNDSVIIKSTNYSTTTLIHFADSIAEINPEIWESKIIQLPDSIFKSQKDLAVELQKKDFSELMDGCKKGALNTDFIKRIFPDFRLDSANYAEDILKGYLPISYYSFDDNKYEFKNFAIVLGYTALSWECKVFFFSNNLMISEHNVFHRYGLDLRHFKNSNGNTVCYYRQNFQSGSGIWWFNNNFYMFEDNKLIPVLDELQEANLQYPWSIRSYWLRSSIEQFNPLTIKFVYYNEFPDPSNSYPIKVIDDSTIVEYNWDKSSKQYIPDFSKSEQNRFKILTYYLVDNELLFINSHCNLLKELINGDDSLKRQITFSYLNIVKNEMTRRENMASH